jgi:hypothetical protein
MLILLMMTFAILASIALAVLRAFEPSTKTLTILLATLGLLTGTLAQGHKGRNIRKEARISPISNLLGLINLMLITRLIATTHTNTILVADPTPGKAFTIQF